MPKANDAVTTVPSYCRICPASCGVLVDIAADGAVMAVRGDAENPLTRGYTCVKGRHLDVMHTEPARFRTAQHRGDDGQLEPIETRQAIDEVAERLLALASTYGPDSIGMFIGTQTYSSTLTYPVATAWLAALHSHKLFTTNTIDQSAKIVNARRMGWWDGGSQLFDESDVWMLVGTNPIVTMSGGGLQTGFPIHEQAQRLRAVKGQGMRLIVVDPRRSETAARADVHLQLLPGSDCLLFAAMLHVIFDEELQDHEFCRDHVSGMEGLEGAIRSVAPEAVAVRTGLDPDEIRTAARLFATAQRGMVKSATGPDMGPWCNLSAHLLQAINVVCGRFPRAGDPYMNANVLAPAQTRTAQVRRPKRTWETGYQSRLGYGLIGRELPTATIPDEILVPGDDRIRALVVVGGNPAAAIPDQVTTARALSSLELLVTLEPFPGETSELAHYVIAPALQLERADCSLAWQEYFAVPFAQYTPAVLPPPPDVIEDWKFFFELAARMSLTLRVGNTQFEPGAPIPASDEVLDALTAGSRVPLDDVRQHPHGKLYDDLPQVLVAPPDGSGARFDLYPGDVADELSRALAGEQLEIPPERPYLLAVRRDRRTMNTLGRRDPTFGKAEPNRCFMHPEDLAAEGIVAGEVVEVTSAHGSAQAVAGEDDSIRRGVVSMTHCYGALPGRAQDPTVVGTNPGRLLSLTHDRQDINAMPRITGVPVAVTHRVVDREIGT